jgi:hypothetical protein
MSGASRAIIGASASMSESKRPKTASSSESGTVLSAERFLSECVVVGLSPACRRAIIASPFKDSATVARPSAYFLSVICQPPFSAWPIAVRLQLNGNVLQT